MLTMSNLYSKYSQYVGLIVSMAYGLLVVFGLVGVVFFGGYMPLYAVVLACVSWTATRILAEAAVSFELFRMLRSNGKQDDK